MTTGKLLYLTLYYSVYGSAFTSLTILSIIQYFERGNKPTNLTDEIFLSLELNIHHIDVRRDADKIHIAATVCFRDDAYYNWNFHSFARQALWNVAVTYAAESRFIRLRKMN